MKDKAQTALRLFLVLGSLAGLLSAGVSCEGGHSNTESASRKIPLPDLGPATPYPVLEERGVAIVREDDPARTRLYANIFRPQADGRFPTLLEGIAYRREILELGKAPDPTWLASQGYAVILMDVRGTGSSEGQWGCFSDEENADMAWIVDHWIPDQPWSNGKVGLFGPSYMGVNQYMTAARKPEHLKAIFPGVAMADAYRDVFYQGGIFDQEFIYFWALATTGLSILPGTQLAKDPLSALKALGDHVAQIPEILAWLELSTDQTFFSDRSPMTYWSDLAGLPTFATGGWFCIFTRGTVLNHIYLEKEARKLVAKNPALVAPKRLVVGEWYHVNGALLQGLPSKELHKRWFDWHLKADEDPLYARYDILDPRYPVNLFVMGEDRWRKEEAWPLERAEYTPFYLSGERQVNDRNTSLDNASLLWPEERDQLGAASGSQEPTRISHRPPDYAGDKSRSTARWIAGITGLVPSAEDERENEEKTLTFSTGPLDRDVEVTGPAILRLWARTAFGTPPEETRREMERLGRQQGADLSPLARAATAPDVHWIVNLNDVFPDGRVRNLTSGWLAASHRRDPERADWTERGYDPFDYPEDAAPSQPEDGKLYEYVIEIWPTSNVFRAGHQIRIDVVNSDVPHLMPSLVPSESEILHDDEHPSRLILPLVAPESTAPAQWIDDPEAYFSGREGW